MGADCVTAGFAGGVGADCLAAGFDASGFLWRKIGSGPGSTSSGARGFGWADATGGARLAATADAVTLAVGVATFTAGAEDALGASVAIGVAGAAGVASTEATGMGATAEADVATVALGLAEAAEAMAGELVTGTST